MAVVITTTTTASGRRMRVTLGAGDVSTPIHVGSEVVVAALPGAGGTLLVEVTWSSEAAVAAGTANWFPWDAGATATKKTQMLLKATAVRFTAALAAAVGEIAQ